MKIMNKLIKKEEMNVGSFKYFFENNITLVTSRFVGPYIPNHLFSITIKKNGEILCHEFYENGVTFMSLFDDFIIREIINLIETDFKYSSISKTVREIKKDTLKNIDRQDSGYTVKDENDCKHIS